MLLLSLCNSFNFDLFRVNEEVVNESEKNLADEKPAGEEDAAEGNKENPTGERAEIEPEEKVWYLCSVCVIPRKVLLHVPDSF